ncbi:MAG TPA: helix-turn-helix transcriptional regulator [Gammaproteobacteria bacterium]|nr:helix-turn-helix transcriptional regulator [Gammaproteobacteria bacterium]
MLPKELCMELAKRLTAVRLQKTWTRELLAKNADINVHTLKRFERTGQISLERLIAICQALDIYQEIERLFKPRHRVDVENWQPISQPQRKRGKRRQTLIEA